MVAAVLDHLWQSTLVALGAANGTRNFTEAVNQTP